MQVSRNTLCVAYLIIGIVASFCTWGNVLGMLSEYGFWEGTIQFWQDVLVNESSRFITADILFFMVAIFLWMILEARRLGLPFVWGYIAFSFFIGPSIGIPLFMVHRELTLSKERAGSHGGTLNTLDVVGLIVCGLVFTVYAGIALTY